MLVSICSSSSLLSTLGYVLTDLDKRPFRCSVDGCSVAFSRNSDLRRHDQSVHKRELKFWCAVSACAQKDVAFARRDHFIQHLATHSSSTAPDARSIISASTNATRKKRRRSPGTEVDEDAIATSVQDEMMRLKAENEELFRHPQPSIIGRSICREDLWQRNVEICTKGQRGPWRKDCHLESEWRKEGVFV